jgi:hypothetical protein
LFAMFDFPKAGFENAVKHGSGGSRGPHESEIVC